MKIIYILFLLSAIVLVNCGRYENDEDERRLRTRYSSKRRGAFVEHSGHDSRDKKLRYQSVSKRRFGGNDENQGYYKSIGGRRGGGEDGETVELSSSQSQTCRSLIDKGGFDRDCCSVTFFKTLDKQKSEQCKPLLRESEQRSIPETQLDEGEFAKCFLEKNDLFLPNLQVDCEKFVSSNKLREGRGPRLLAACNKCNALFNDRKNDKAVKQFGSMPLGAAIIFSNCVPQQLAMSCLSGQQSDNGCHDKVMEIQNCNIAHNYGANQQITLNDKIEEDKSAKEESVKTTTEETSTKRRRLKIKKEESENKKDENVETENKTENPQGVAGRRGDGVGNDNKPGLQDKNNTVPIKSRKKKIKKLRKTNTEDTNKSTTNGTKVGRIKKKMRRGKKTTSTTAVVNNEKQSAPGNKGLKKKLKKNNSTVSTNMP